MAKQEVLRLTDQRPASGWIIRIVVEHQGGGVEIDHQVRAAFGKPVEQPESGLAGRVEEGLACFNGSCKEREERRCVHRVGLSHCFGEAVRPGRPLQYNFIVGPGIRIIRSRENQITLLLVDDDPMVIESLGPLLERSGFHVLTATQGEEALSKVQAHHPDVIVMDVLMPRMNGRET